jgi:hypothetical protein
VERVHVLAALHETLGALCVARALAGNYKYAVLVDPLSSAPVEAHAALAAELLRAACSGRHVLVTLPESMHHVFAALLSEGISIGYTLRDSALVRVRRPEGVTPPHDAVARRARKAHEEWLARLEKLYAAYRAGSSVALRDALDEFFGSPCGVPHAIRAALETAILARVLAKGGPSR